VTPPKTRLPLIAITWLAIEARIGVGRRGLARNHVLCRVGGHVENARKVIKRDVFGLDTEQAILKPADELAQALIGRG
jgi:hypothetical protein